jgi:5'-nucleotidase/UDP-sugar diphosphatase
MPRIRHLAVYIVTVLAGLSCTGSEHTRTRISQAALTILHWNDYHAQITPISVRDSTSDSLVTVGGAAVFASYVNRFRNESRNVSVLNAGDNFQGTPISAFTFGRSEIELLNLIRPDAVAIGNHEFDYGVDSLRVNMTRAAFPILCANVVNTTTNEPLGLPYLVEHFGPVTVGMIGLAPPDLEALTFRKNIAGWRVRDTDSTLNLYIAKIKSGSKPNLIVLISHLGFDQDTMLALRRRDIDVIVGGHTHLALFEPVRKNHTIIVQAGSRGQFLGKLDLTVDLEGDSVVTYRGELIQTNVNGVRPDPTIAAIVSRFDSLVDLRLGHVIGTLRTPWIREGYRKKESNIGSFHADAIRAAAGTDVGLINVGSLRKDQPAGDITLRDVWEINPFGNVIVTFPVRGDTLRKIIEWQVSSKAREFLQVSGIRYVFDSSKPDGQQLLSLEVGGAPINLAAVYTISTNSYVSEHPMEFFGIPRTAITPMPTGLIDHDAVGEYVASRGEVRSEVDGRILDVAATTHESQ